MSTCEKRGGFCPRCGYRACMAMADHVAAEARQIRHHGRHPWLQPGDRPHRVWMLRFDDNDRRDMVWTDDDAEDQARAAYAKFSPSWNCYLFAAVAADEVTEKGAPQP